MSHRDLPGSGLVIQLVGWMVLLPVLAVTVQILVVELAKWLKVLAPWLLLTVLIGLVLVAGAALVRRRRYGY